LYSSHNIIRMIKSGSKKWAWTCSMHDKKREIYIKGEGEVVPVLN